MRLTPHRRTTAYRLQLPEGTLPEALIELLRRYDPETLRRRNRLVAGSFTVTVRGRAVIVPAGKEILARGMNHHLGGEWVTAPPQAGESDEPLQDLIRVYVPRKLLPAEVATVIRPVLPNVAIREDTRLGLFWFDDEDSELTVSAWETQTIPRAAAHLPEPVYEVGIDDVQGPTADSAEQAWRMARLLELELGGIAVDRYGFRLTGANELSQRPIPGTPTQ